METLVVLDLKTYSVQPGCREWKVVDDKPINFSAQGRLFHDGAPFNAEAVKYSIERFNFTRNQSPRGILLNMIDQMRIVDPHTLQVP